MRDGWDGAHTFNISPPRRWFVAGAGLTVAKHGNRSVSSKSGSADVLSALGVEIDLPPELRGGLRQRGRDRVSLCSAVSWRHETLCCSKAGIGNPHHAESFGPLTNPAGATIQVVGVFESRFTSLLGNVLMHLGSQHCFVVHGMDGLDEITLTGKRRFQRPKAVFFRIIFSTLRSSGWRWSIQRTRRGTPQDNAMITRDILQGGKARNETSSA